MASRSAISIFTLPAVASVKLCLAVLRIIFRRRPHPRWDLRQTTAVEITKIMLRIMSTLRISPKLSLSPGSEGNRFVTVIPAARDLYKGPTDDKDIRPRTVGGTWTPKLPDTTRAGESGDSLLVALHFHGGAYVIGDGRDGDTGFLIQTLLNHGGFTHVFTPQYRLSNRPDGRFPAALQDAVSTYVYLLRELGIPASCIVVSGDSAGGNLALALLRYIQEFGSELDLALPAALTLWSPWTDVAGSIRKKDIVGPARYATDYLDYTFCQWGSSAFLGHGKIAPLDPYVSVVADPSSSSRVPIWVHTGGMELLYDENRKFVEHFRRNGADVEWVLDEHCPHDILLLGKTLGFQKEAEEAAGKAGDFVRPCVAGSEGPASGKDR
ncbi:hypothetical protein jhhlp_000488 [Lomentospora prolificans]|uniref:Alpha/beta hydrolase fold-3 domain-containing protein n=1 Tax=Lomentospora prolificans TaxID=41688 RepID=A0A2N3NL07_9PEZI|nr:hypothetical protein jhhlp_000488 [Lomentospora prolificans]